MSLAKLIGPSPALTPPGALNSAGRREIPDDLLREASVRLGILSLLGAVLWAVGTITGHAADSATKGIAAWTRFDTTDGIAVFMVIVSLALFVYTRRSKR